MPYFSCIVLPLWQRIPLTMEEVQRVQGKRKAWNKIPSQVPQCRIPLQLVFVSPGVLTPVPQRPVLPSHALLDQASSKKENLSVYVLLYFTQCISSFTSSLKLSPHLHSNLHSLRSINVPGKIFNCLLFCPQTHHPAQWPNWNFQPQSSTFPFLLPFFTGPITFQNNLGTPLCSTEGSSVAASGPRVDLTSITLHFRSTDAPRRVSDCVFSVFFTYHSFFLVSTYPLPSTCLTTSPPHHLTTSPPHHLTTLASVWTY